MSHHQTNERSIAAYLWFFGWLAVGGWFLSDALPPTGADARASVSVSPTAPKSLPIEQITVGRRVTAANPTGEEDLQFGRSVDPATWKKLTLKAPKRDGSVADVVLLRPDEWLAEQGARVGGTVEISVPECGIDGLARVLAIENCPPIADGGGQVVTGTFRHHSAAVIDIAVDGEDEPIGTTANHPFWSEDKQAFVRADQLQPSEMLRTLGGLTTVKSITSRAGPEPVYNIEVAVAHTYHVGVGGVLVHNGGLGQLPILGDCDLTTFGGVTSRNADEESFLRNIVASFGDGSAYKSAKRFDGAIIIQRNDIPFSVQNIRSMSIGNTPRVLNRHGEYEIINLHHISRGEGKLIEVIRSHNAYNPTTGGHLHIPGPGSPSRSSTFTSNYWKQRLVDAYDSGQVQLHILQESGVDINALRQSL